MNYAVHVLLFSISMSSLVACQKLQASPTTDIESPEKQSVVTLLKQYEVAVNNSDIEQLVKLHTDEAVRISADEPVIVSKTAIRNRVTADHAEYAYNLSSRIKDIEIDDNLATLRATYSETLTFRQNEADAATTKGDCLLFLQRQADGKWKILAEIWNEEAMHLATE